MSEALLDILTFQSGYNTNLVLIGSTLLGVAASIVGVFMILRKRALVSDAISHATLPGVALGFLAALALGLNDGRHLPTILTGAALTGLVGVFCVQWIHQNTRLTEDTAIGTVLSVFYGAGIVLLSYIQSLGTGSRAGLDSFLLGQAAGLTKSEAYLICFMAVIVIVVAFAFVKELGLICFDPDYAQSTGHSLFKLDILMMALMLAVVCIGLKTVGLVLIIAMLIIPPVAARFWTNRLGGMILLSGLFGGLSSFGGTVLSALLPDLPTGAVIVLSAALLFFLSLILAPQRGVISRVVSYLSTKKEITGGHHA